jgi:hypothetical protein
VNDNTITINRAEHERLQSCEQAWCAVVDALSAGNPDLFMAPGTTGIAAALGEIARLQAVREG